MLLSSNSSFLLYCQIRKEKSTLKTGFCFSYFEHQIFFIESSSLSSGGIPKCPSPFSIVKGQSFEKCRELTPCTWSRVSNLPHPDQADASVSFGETSNAHLVCLGVHIVATYSGCATCKAIKTKTKLVIWFNTIQELLLKNENCSCHQMETLFFCTVIKRNS